MIRVGLIGFGLGGRVFHAPLVSSVEGMELAAILERTSNKAAARYPGVVTCRSLEEMLADTSLDLFVVSTPNATHFDLARQILETGRSVVVDKPLGASSSEIAELMELASSKQALLIPFHNRRWDSDFQTIRKLLHEELLGRLVSFESRFDRWRPAMPTDRIWKDDPAAAGGQLLDLGTHIADQALVLFGKPESVSADLYRERDGAKSNDSFAVRLHYAGFLVTLGGNCLSLPAGPRFHLRGTDGNYWKSGVDPQEAALNQITHIDDPNWGHEHAANWGMLHIGIDGGTVTRPVEPVPGDYRLYYAGVRDALLGKAEPPVAAVDAWRVARVLECAAESAEQRREIVCDWGGEPG